MSLMKSTMLPLGTPLPAFQLPDANGKVFDTSALEEGTALLIAIWCNHCPYVKQLKQAFADFVGDYDRQYLETIAINANDIKTHPSDGPAEMLKDVERFGYDFPYLLDESQEVAKTLKAVCTPEFYVFDTEHRLAYRGRFDSATPGNSDPVTGEDLCAAVTAVLLDEPVPEPQHPSMGCSVKWKPGNAPAYLG
jgi:thiol-disulfide isomerase/thioredoxin